MKFDPSVDYAPLHTCPSAVVGIQEMGITSRLRDARLANTWRSASIAAVLLLALLAVGASAWRNRGSFSHDTANHYEVLGVRSDSSTEDIRKAYKKLARTWHPDKHVGQSAKAAQEKFVAINAAHEVLSDDGKRREYDLSRSGGRSSGHGGQSWRHAQYHGFRPHHHNRGPFAGDWYEQRRQAEGGGSGVIPTTTMVMMLVVMGLLWMASLCLRNEQSEGQYTNPAAAGAPGGPQPGGRTETTPHPQTPQNECSLAMRKRVPAILQLTPAVLDPRGRLVVVFVLPRVEEIANELWSLLGGVAATFKYEPRVSLAWLQPGTAVSRIPDAMEYHTQWRRPLFLWMKHSNRPSIFVVRRKSSGCHAVLFDGELSNSSVAEWIGKLLDGGIAIPKAPQGLEAPLPLQ